MNHRFDLNKLWFSILIIRPTPDFFVWLQGLVKLKGWAIENIYFAEENGVWLIPQTGSFEVGELETYVERLKPAMLRAELERFGPLLESDVPGEWNALLFDRFFEVEIRDSPTLYKP